MTSETQILHSLHGALELLIHGAAHELTEQCDIPQPKADIKVLQTVFTHLDLQVDLPTLLVGPILTAISVSIENDRKDALAKATHTSPW